MKQLNTKENIENIALMWHDVLEPLLAEQQRLMVTGRDGPCTPDELRGFSIAYRAIEKFAEAGMQQIEAQAKK